MTGQETGSNMNTEEPGVEQTEEPRKPTKWEDPSVPAGNAPPMPRWPFGLMLTLWIAWVGFLAAIAFGVL